MSDAPERIWLDVMPGAMSWNMGGKPDYGNFSEYIRADVAAAMVTQARQDALREANARWRRNGRDTFDAMVAMRNDLNQLFPMPSLESDLLQGPDASVFCAAVVEAVRDALRAAKKDALVDAESACASVWISSDGDDAKGAHKCEVAIYELRANA